MGREGKVEGGGWSCDAGGVAWKQEGEKCRVKDVCGEVVWEEEVCSR